MMMVLVKTKVMVEVGVIIMKIMTDMMVRVYIMVDVVMMTKVMMTKVMMMIVIICKQ